MALYKTGNPVPSSAMPDVWDNNRVQDEILNSEELEVETRTGIMTPTWKGVLKKNEDEIEETRQNLIPLSRQYMTLADAQADIANIPMGSTTYYRSPDDSALAIEVMNVGGTLTATGRKMPSQEYVESVDEYVTTRLFSDVLPGIPFLLQDEESGVIMFGEDSGATHVPGLSLKYG
ncbi:TPA: flagellar biosynthesis protein, partial [Klebsiella pneumoniae]